MRQASIVKRPAPAAEAGADRELLSGFRAAVDARLDELVPLQGDRNGRLLEAARYSLLAPGKRIRPTLTLSAAHCFGVRGRAALDPACAIEMTHTASLIVDDLPCMDDARLRRGRPANHRVFGEHVATLAAFELLNGAFGVIARAPVPSQLRARLAACLSTAVGAEGLIGGQLLDLESSRRRLDGAQILDMYGRKTGALLAASIEFGALLAGVSEPAVLARLSAFSHDFGLAFQILDDLGDRYGSCESIGKDVGQDALKANLLSCVGAGEACDEVRRLLRVAGERLAPLGPAGERLSDLARALLVEAAVVAGPKPVTHSRGG